MRLAATIAAALILLTGCAAPAAGTPSPSAAAAGTSVPGAVSPEPASLQPDPALREAQSPGPDFDYGYVVDITPTGLRPKTLLSGCCKPVTWKNLTGQTVSIVFDHQLVDSGPIAAGSAWVFTPHNAESVLYHTGQGPPLQGALQVQQTTDG